ncbi:MAG TPA: type II secretion system secretin GspD [Rhodanobacteraceae bacterium]|nr:type II secretion system secretin GspD [Rhodanobacteraceae bacterium]
MLKKLATLALIGALTALAGCAPQIKPSPDYSLQREAIEGTHKPVPQPLHLGSSENNEPLAASAPAEQQYGTGVFINGVAAGRPGTRGAANTKGTIVFNFDNQPVQAAVKAILGDVLGANYSISPDVKGTVTFSTSRPVSRDEVLPILQMLLSWTGNALVRQDNRYLVVPVDQAAPGNLVPGLSAVAPDMGYAARLFPLHYVSADAMQKLLKPFADPKAFLLVDPLRNLIVMGGTPEELANYQRIVRTFDVDWLRGMSVAVIPLQHVQADDLVNQLENLFSEQSDGKGKQMSSLIRLLPLKHSNSLVVITPQPSYIDEVRKLVTTIDNGAGNSSGLYVYNVLNVKASDLARHLNELFGNSTGNGAGQAGAVAPGFSQLEQSTGMGAQQGFGSFTPDESMGGTDSGGLGSGGGVGAGMVSGATQARRQQQTQSVAFTTSEGVRIAAVNENNQLLIRAKPGQWEKLLPVIERLDEKPLQVQIETKVLEVTLQGEFQFGVQYYLGGLIGTQPGSPPNTNESYHRHQGSVGLGGVAPNATNPPALFYSFAGNKLQFALQALETSGDTKVLSAPSTVVLNNQETTFKVGQKIPVVQTFYTPGLPVGGSSTTGNVGQVQYIDTGVLLDVVPRVSPGGLVYMDVQQIVSNPTTKDQYGNYTIANRSLSTEVAVQSGQTVLLGGLIQQSDSTQDNGVPFLNRIPILGRLFGTTDRTKSRSELIVLITPRVIRDPEDARRVTDQYETQFESLKPILPGGAMAPVTPASDAAPAAPADPAAPTPTPAEVRPLGTDPSTSVVPTGMWSVQVAAFTDRATADSLRLRLQQLGYASYVDTAQAPAGTQWRVRAGPVISRSAAEQLRSAIAGSLHISGMQVTQR